MCKPYKHNRPLTHPTNHFKKERTGFGSHHSSGDPAKCQRSTEFPGFKATTNYKLPWGGLAQYTHVNLCQLALVCAFNDVSISEDYST